MVKAVAERAFGGGVQVSGSQILQHGMCHQVRIFQSSKSFLSAAQEGGLQQSAGKIASHEGFTADQAVVPGGM
jgi:hypothetical protein